MALARLGLNFSVEISAGIARALVLGLLALAVLAGPAAAHGRSGDGGPAKAAVRVATETLQVNAAKLAEPGRPADAVLSVMSGGSASHDGMASPCATNCCSACHSAALGSDGPAALSVLRPNSRSQEPEREVRPSPAFRINRPPIAG